MSERELWKQKEKEFKESEEYKKSPEYQREQMHLALKELKQSIKETYIVKLVTRLIKLMR